MKMREIKFRAWDGMSWVYSECISKDGINWWILNNEDDNWFTCLDPQQYTGLKDKNGKEIYEGDITKDKFGNLDVICWINSSGAYATVSINLYLDGEYEHTVVDEFGTDCFFENNVPGDFLEVIGNIYENPELLEESK